MNSQCNEPQDRSLTRTLLAGLVLTVLGFLGNMYSLPVGFGVSFLFGSIFVVLASLRLGIVAGAVVALLSASYTYHLWNHPYAVIIFTFEAIWIAFFFRQNRKNIVMLDMLFWLVIGLPLIWVFYYVVMSLGKQATVIIYLKQTINGVFNALVASIVIHHLPLHKICPKCFGERKGVSYSTIVFHLTASFLMVPTLALLLVGNFRELRSLKKLKSTFVAKEAQEAKGVIEIWLKAQSKAMLALAEQASRQEIKSDPEFQATLEFFIASSPAFHNAYIANSEATSVAFYPAVNKFGKSTIGLNFRDREYFKQVKAGTSPYISDVFQGRGGVFEPIFTISAPITRDNEFSGYCLGAIDLKHLRNVLNYNKHLEADGVTIFDQHANIVCSNIESNKPLAPFHAKDGSTLVLENGVEIWTPSAQKNVSIMDSWKNGVLLYRVPIEGTSWTLQAEASVGPLQTYIFDGTIINLSLVFGLFLLATLVSFWVSQGVAKTPALLASISQDLPDKLSSQEKVVWPSSRIVEMNNLASNFKQAARTIRDQFTQIQAANYMLEKRVSDRTNELKGLTEDLEDRIETEINLRRQSEEFVLQQAKLAAMGEMIGAIAHQWRQPLNALGIIIQNNMELYELDQLDEVLMNESSERALSHVRLMSRTIDDFRNFFKPDKEKSVFDLIEATGNVFSLFSAQMGANNISFVLKWNGAPVDSTFKASSSESSVFGFRNEFEHVILNLISNSKDAIFENLEASSEFGEIDVNIDTKGDSACITIADNGGGISTDVIDQIFEPYVSTKEKKHGTGMGLYMSKVIIEEHMSGSLWADNGESGAVFHIKLPLHQSEENKR